MKPIFMIWLFATLQLCCTAQREIPSRQSAETSMSVDEQLMAKARALSQKYIITDGHVDLPYRLKIQNFRLEKEYLGIPIETDRGDFDYVRAKKGGLDAPFMSIYIPADNQKEKGKSKKLADDLIDMIEGIVESHPNKFAIAHWAGDVEEIFKLFFPMFIFSIIWSIV